MSTTANAVILITSTSIFPWRLSSLVRSGVNLRSPPGGSSDSGKGGPAVLRISLPDGSAPYIWNNRKNDMDFQFTEVRG